MSSEPPARPDREAPAGRVLVDAAAHSLAVGHENAGFLSEEYGFLPRAAPLLALPPACVAWDEAAAQLPQLWREQRVRAALEVLPVLAADAACLPDAYLQRAATVLSFLAHAYVRAERPERRTLPEALRRPWVTVSQRLGRRQPILAYADLILYNWRLRSPSSARTVEDMELLVPTVGNQAEQIFYLTQVEIHATCAPAIGAVVRAQEAVLREDRPALEVELVRLVDVLQRAGEVSLQKIDPNPRSRTYVDSVVWAKTVAPFAVPISDGVQGPSGTSAPIFHLLDAFVGRGSFESLLGQETLSLREWFAPNWLALLEAVSAVSVGAWVRASGDRQLKGIFQSLLDGYVGERGFLAAHRLKVYGYLETAFKMGRSSTIGGFKGHFKDREWDRIDVELDRTRAERSVTFPREPVRATVLPNGAIPAGVAQLRMDVTGTGVRYRPGDRCAVLPENDGALVERTLAALRATGDEVIRLDGVWRTALRARIGADAPAEIALRALLRYGALRPVRRAVARALLRLTGLAQLHDIVDARAEDQWEVWDLLDLLTAHGFDPRRLWRAEPWEPESVCRLVPPENERLYSIASAGAANGSRLDLLVGPLSYQTETSPTTRAATRHGVTSSYLRDLSARGGTLTLRTVPAPRFHLPVDPTQPIVLIAGGSGVAPFPGFLEARAQQPGAGSAWLMYAAESSGRVPITPTRGVGRSGPAASGPYPVTRGGSATNRRLPPPGPGAGGPVVVAPVARRRWPGSRTLRLRPNRVCRHGFRVHP